MQNRIRNRVQELRKRSAIRALIAYGVVAWMLLQVPDVTFDRLPIPENSITNASCCGQIRRSKRCRTMNGSRSLFPTRAIDNCTYEYDYGVNFAGEAPMDPQNIVD